MLVIQSIRFGAETNSSSTHSFIMIPGVERIIDDISQVESIGSKTAVDLLLKDSEVAGFLVSLIHSKTKVDDEKARVLKNELGVKKIITKVQRGDKEFKINASLTKYLTIDTIERTNFKMINNDEQTVFEFMVKIAKKILEDKRILVFLGNDNFTVTPGQVYTLKTLTPIETDDFEYHPIDNLKITPFILTKPGNYFNLLVLGDTPLKLRFKDDKVEHLEPEYPESIDLKITNQCMNQCSYCHEGSTPDGEHADFELFKQLIDQVSGGTLEVALGGGNPALHPKLKDMIKYANSKGVSVGVTMLDIDFLKNYPLIHAKELTYASLYPAYGISASSYSTIKKVINRINHKPGFGIDFVIHFINRVHSQEFIEKVIEYYLNNTEYKDSIGFLILGYKEFGRGAHYTPPHDDLNVDELFNKYGNEVRLLFDNLAVKQLGIQKKVSKKVWDFFYLGDDGQYTMYIDLVNKEYAVSSYEEKRFKFETLDVKSMFKKVRMLAQQQ